ncbi:MAG: 1-acyl-sn-glycerol-3-phosphate acyltransferase [Agarilytica sp.]
MFNQFLYKVNYSWRVFATGLSFSLFGIGGPVIALALAVLLYLVPISESAKSSLARNAIRYAFKLYVNFMKLCGLLTYEVRGKENIPDGGQLLIANHPSLLDVVFIMSQVRGANCIVKEGLHKNLFTRPPIRAAKFIINSNDTLVDTSVASLAQNAPLLVFPEGTRSIPNEPVAFQRGASNIALAAGCDIVPVLISCTPPTLMKHQKWYDIPATPPHFLIEFQPIIDITKYKKDERPHSKVTRSLTRDLVAYFSEKISSAVEH